MGIYSTLCITRSKAKETFLEHCHGEISDAFLESFMAELLEPRLFNCRIVPDDWENDNDNL